MTRLSEFSSSVARLAMVAGVVACSFGSSAGRGEVVRLVRLRDFDLAEDQIPLPVIDRVDRLDEWADAMVAELSPCESADGAIEALQRFTPNSSPKGTREERTYEDLVELPFVVAARRDSDWSVVVSLLGRAASVGYYRFGFVCSERPGSEPGLFPWCFAIRGGHAGGSGLGPTGVRLTVRDELSDGSVGAIRSLLTRLVRTDGNVAVVLDCDGDVSLETVLSVVAASRAAGVTAVVPRPPALRASRPLSTFDGQRFAVTFADGTPLPLDVGTESLVPVGTDGAVGFRDPPTVETIVAVETWSDTLPLPPRSRVR